MALVSMVPSGKYAVCETDRLASRTTGEIKNQYALDGTDFATIPAQNGMLLVVNEFTKTIKLPTAITNAVYVHVSPCKDYQGLGKDTIAVSRGELLPVMYKMKVGDKITTNCVKFDDGTYADVAAVTAAISATAVFGIPDATGYIKLVAALGGSETHAWKILETTTLSNGATALRMACVLAG